MLFINSYKKVIAGFLFFISLFIISISCDSTEPTDELKPGRRDYTWTTDTVKIPFKKLTRIWGSSPTDVWAIGSGGGLDQAIWHYDGISWKTDYISRGIGPDCIFGFSASDVWIAGGEGKIWHFDGIEWTFNHEFKKNGYAISFSDLWGEAYNNIYAVGYADSSETRKAIILHFNGNQWIEKKIPNINTGLVRIRKDQSIGKYYLDGLGGSSTIIVSLFKYDGNSSLTKIYESNYSIATNSITQKLLNAVYFVIGYKINKYDGKHFNEIININEPQFGSQIWGRTLKDIFLRMFDGLAHYNGENVQYLFNYNTNSGISIIDAVLFDNEIFCLAIDWNKDQNIIYRGKLN